MKILRSVDHPNIVKYFETYEEDCKIHIVTEHIPGLNISELINFKRKQFNEEELLEAMNFTIKNKWNKNKIRQFAIDNFSVDKIGKEFDEIYRSI